MIGFYNYTVVLTYIGFASAIVGLMQLIQGNYLVSIICLLVSGGCDMFDGIVARTKKDRTKQEVSFGIQLDSLCDAVCFGVLPAMFNYTISLGHKYAIISIPISIMFSLFAIIRLGFFNVMEEERQETTNEKRKSYQGLPVTSVAIFFPIVYLFKDMANANFYILSNIALFVIAVLFVTNFSVKKPGKNGFITMCVFGLIMITLLVIKNFK